MKKSVIAAVGLLCCLFIGAVQARATVTYSQGGHGCAGCETCDSASCICHEFDCDQMQFVSNPSSGGPVGNVLPAVAAKATPARLSKEAAALKKWEAILAKGAREAAAKQKAGKIEVTGLSTGKRGAVAGPGAGGNAAGKQVYGKTKEAASNACATICPGGYTLTPTIPASDHYGCACNDKN